MLKPAAEASHWSRTSILYRSFYFVFYAGYMSFLLYVPVYFKYLGLTAIQVGLLNGIRPLMQTIGAPLWGIIGDKFRIRRVVFLSAFVVMTVKTMSFLLFRPQNQICVVSYYNTSNDLVKNTSYVIQHSITKAKRSSVRILAINSPTSLELRGNKTGKLPALQSRERSERLLEFRNLTSYEYKKLRKDGGVEKAATSEGKPIFSTNVSLGNDNIVIKKYKSFVVMYTTVYDDHELTYIFIAIMLLIIFGDTFDAAVFTLADTSCLDTLGGENYGYYRLWGSAGWGIMTPIIGFFISHFSAEKCGVDVGAYFCIFYFYLGFMYLATLFGSHFDFKYECSEVVSKTVKNALLNFHYGIFLFVTFYAGFCYGFLLYFVNWYIDSLGGTALIMGAATACKSVVDVLFFFFSGRIIVYLGHLNTVTISLIAYIVAFVSYSYISEPWHAVPVEVLHSGAYALVWSASVSYLNQAAPAGSSATVQGILQGVYWGLGTGGGTIIGGYMIHVFGFTSTFQAFAVSTSVILVVFLMTQLLSKISNLPEEKVEESGLITSQEESSPTADSESETDDIHDPYNTDDLPEEKHEDILLKNGLGESREEQDTPESQFSEK